MTLLLVSALSSWSTSASFVILQFAAAAALKGSVPWPGGGSLWRPSIPAFARHSDVPRQGRSGAAIDTTVSDDLRTADPVQPSSFNTAPRRQAPRALGLVQGRAAVRRRRRSAAIDWRGAVETLPREGPTRPVPAQFLPRATAPTAPSRSRLGREYVFLQANASIRHTTAVLDTGIPAVGTDGRTISPPSTAPNATASALPGGSLASMVPGSHAERGIHVALKEHLSQPRPLVGVQSQLPRESASRDQHVEQHGIAAGSITPSPRVAGTVGHAPATRPRLSGTAVPEADGEHRQLQGTDQRHDSSRSAGDAGKDSSVQSAPMPAVGAREAVWWSWLEMIGSMTWWLAAASGLLLIIVHKQRRTARSSIYREVEGLCVTSGMELQSMFSMRCANEHLLSLPLHTGRLTRIQARVVAQPGGTLLAPFSGRPCVFYSASVTQSRHDGIHHLPLAFHTAASDFLLELPDAAQCPVAVKSQDVTLFDMAAGLQLQERAFMAVPDSWRAFVLAHLAPSTDASAHFESCLDLSSEGGLLEFRECALLVGSPVTCVGELVRDRAGTLGLHPWRPQSRAGAKCQLGAWHWMVPSWGRTDPTARLGDGLHGRVLVSDDPDLSGSAMWRTHSQWWLAVPEYV